MAADEVGATTVAEMRRLLESAQRELSALYAFAKSRGMDGSSEPLHEEIAKYLSKDSAATSNDEAGIYFVNLFARDETNCRDLTDDAHRAKPYRAFVYFVHAKSPVEAAEKVNTHRSLPDHWGDIFACVQNPEDPIDASVPYLDSSNDVGAEEVANWKRMSQRSRVRP